MCSYRALLLMLVLPLALTYVCPVEAAAPRLLMLYGKPLEKPVLLADWPEIFKLITTSTEWGRHYLERTRRSSLPEIGVVLGAGMEPVRRRR